MTTEPLPIQPGYGAPPPPPRPWRPWWRRGWAAAAGTGVAGLLLGSAAAAGASQPASEQVAAPAVMSTATVTRTPPAVTRTVQAEPPATRPAVAAVLTAWTDYGPEPGRQRAAMARLRRDWPTLARALDRATGERPQPVAPVAAAPTRTATRTAARAPAPVETTRQPEPPTQVYYANCTAARAAGAAPIMRGEPGYRAALDRDDDGIACEW